MLNFILQTAKDYCLDISLVEYIYLTDRENFYQRLESLVQGRINV